MIRALLVLGVCVVVLALGGCGGGDDSASTSSGTSAEVTPTPRASNQSATPSPDKSHQGSGKQNGGEPSGSSPQGEGSKQASTSPKHLKLVKVPAISSSPKAGSKRPAPGVKTVPGADNSVQEYGVEADGSERTEAAIALQAYLNARAEEDWGAACSLLAQKPTEQLERVQRAAAKQGKDLGGCAATMALLREGEAQSLQQAQITEVLSLRGGGEISGDPSYLLFSAPPGNTLFSMPMYLQGGTWKVGLARAAELPLG